MPPCRPTTKILPATFSWVLLISCTSVFFICSSEYLAVQYNPAILIYEGLLTVFVFANFGLATFKNPGTYPRAHEDEIKSDDVRSPLYRNAEVHGLTMRMKWCQTCQFYRPPRCSHCSVCNSCIEVFDHHCPWVNNCIGRSNYRFFFLFLLSLSLNMLSIFSFSLLYVIGNKDVLATVNNILLILVMIVIGILFFPIVGLTGFHFYLIARGRTTNEQVTGKMKGGNPFDGGCLYNCRFTLCGPVWPKLTGRRIKRLPQPCNGERMIYQASTNGNRVYMDSSYGNQTSVLDATSPCSTSNYSSTRNMASVSVAHLDPGSEIPLGGSAFALAMAPPPRNLTKSFTFCQPPAVSIESIFDTPHPSQHLLGMGKVSADASTERCSSEGCVAASASGISDNYNQSLACDQKYPMTHALITDSRGQIPSKNLPRRSLPVSRTSPVDPRIRSSKVPSIHQSHQRDEPASEGRTRSKSNPVRRPVSFVRALEISDLVAVEVQLEADKRCSQNEKSPDAEDELQSILEISV